MSEIDKSDEYEMVPRRALELDPEEISALIGYVWCVSILGEFRQGSLKEERSSLRR
jgi:hypothetical protein